MQSTLKGAVEGHYDPYNQVFSDCTGITGAVRFCMGVLKGRYEGR